MMHLVLRTSQIISVRPKFFKSSFDLIYQVFVKVKEYVDMDYFHILIVFISVVFIFTITVSNFAMYVIPLQICKMKVQWLVSIY